MREWAILNDSDDPLVQDAHAALISGDAVSAERAAVAALQLDGDMTRLTLVRGLALRRQGKQRRAVDILKEVIGKVPPNVALWTLMGLCQRDLGDWDAATVSFERARTIAPDYHDTLYHLAVVLQERGQLERAVKVFQSYLSTSDGRGHALAWSLLGVALRALERFAESAEAIEQAVALDPEDIPTRNALVITHYQAGNEAAAVAAGHAALKMKDDLATRRNAEMGLGLSLSQRDAPFDPSDRTKNIISFSLWGDDPVYTHGAIVNAQISPNIYPGWMCRFYCDETVPVPIRDELRRLGAEIHMMRDPRLLPLKALWRFLAADDDHADRFICRDADSRLNIQEALAVDAWTRTDRPFHVMRDHPYHMEVMLAGMWGGVTRVLPNIRELTKVVATFSPNRWNDQEFLRDVIWPLIRERSCVHDSHYRFRNAEDFPEAGRLVGQVHVGGAIKSMPPWPVPAWISGEAGTKRAE